MWDIRSACGYLHSKSYGVPGTTATQGWSSRGLPLGIVLGPRGSGTTFFVLQYMASRFLNVSETDMVTIDLKATSTLVSHARKKIEFTGCHGSFVRIKTGDKKRKVKHQRKAQ